MVHYATTAVYRSLPGPGSMHSVMCMYLIFRGLSNKLKVDSPVKGGKHFDRVCSAMGTLEEGPCGL